MKQQALKVLFYVVWHRKLSMGTAQTQVFTGA